MRCELPLKGDKITSCTLTTPSSTPASKKNHSVYLIWNGSVQNVQKKQYKFTNIHNLIFHSSIIILYSSLVLKKKSLPWHRFLSPSQHCIWILQPKGVRGGWSSVLKLITSHDCQTLTKHHYSTASLNPPGTSVYLLPLLFHIPPLNSQVILVARQGNSRKYLLFRAIGRLEESC